MNQENIVRERLINHSYSEDQDQPLGPGNGE